MWDTQARRPSPIRSHNTARGSISAIILRIMYFIELNAQFSQYLFFFFLIKTSQKENLFLNKNSSEPVLHRFINLAEKTGGSFFTKH